MEATDFIQEINFLTLDRLKCLRGDYYHNKCSLCIDICPINAVSIVRNKITISSTCTNCGVCVGICPSEAIHIKSFDENKYTIEYEYKNQTTISCKNECSCLAVFDTQHLISMASRKQNPISCDLSHCDECSINVENKIKTLITQNIEIANSFLVEIACKQIDIIDKKSKVEASRRGLFAKVLNATQTIKEDKNLNQKISENIIHSKVPTKKQILKNSLKRFDNLDSFELTKEYNFITNKIIHYNSCTLCKECIEFCPTNALSLNMEQNTILYQSGKCINCHICNDICKEKAIMSSYSNVNIVDFAFDRVTPLVSYRLEICQDCKCSFAYKSGDTVCDRCAKFRSPMFQDIFKIASDME